MASLNFVKIIAGLYHLPFSSHPLGPFKTRYQLTCRLGFLLNLIFLWHLVDRLGGFHFRLIGHCGRFVRSRLFCSLFFFFFPGIKAVHCEILGRMTITDDRQLFSFNILLFYLFKHVLAAGSAISPFHACSWYIEFPLLKTWKRIEDAMLLQDWGIQKFQNWSLQNHAVHPRRGPVFRDRRISRWILE